MQNASKIGELAARCGVSPDTIRFYEREGLLPPPHRTPSGHRVYDSDAFVRLQFIRRAQGTGLTLQDIGKILLRRDRKELQVEEFVKLLRARAEAIDREMAKLLIHRRSLAEGIALCEASGSSALSVLEQLFSIGER